MSKNVTQKQEKHLENNANCLFAYEEMKEP